MNQSLLSQNETNPDARAEVPDMLRFFDSVLGKEVKEENYDDFDSESPLEPPLRGRLTSRYDQSGFRRRQKSPCLQIKPPKRKTQPIEMRRQGLNIARNPSTTEILPNSSLLSPQPSYSSMTGGSNQSLPSLYSNLSSSTHSIDSISSASSSSGLRILPNDPSRSCSRDTLDDVHSLRSSTVSLNQKMDVEESGSEFKIPTTQNLSKLKVS